MLEPLNVNFFSVILFNSRKCVGKCIYFKISGTFHRHEIFSIPVFIHMKNKIRIGFSGEGLIIKLLRNLSHSYRHYQKQLHWFWGNLMCPQKFVELGHLFRFVHNNEFKKEIWGNVSLKLQGPAMRPKADQNIQLFNLYNISLYLTLVFCCLTVSGIYLLCSSLGVESLYVFL